MCRFSDLRLLLLLLLLSVELVHDGLVAGVVAQALGRQRLAHHTRERLRTGNDMVRSQTEYRRGFGIRRHRRSDGGPRTA